MKRSDELKQKRTGLLKEIEPLSTKADLTAEEQKSFDEKTTEIEALDKEIARTEKQEEMAKRAALAGGIVIPKEDDKDIRKFSLSRAIRIAAGMESNDGIEAEMRAEGRKELAEMGKKERGFAIPSMALHRASTGQNVATAADGGNLVQEQGLMFFDALVNELILAKMGATVLTGLQGDVPLVTGGTFTASFVAEDGDLSVTKMATSKATMKPKRLGAAGALSKQLLLQSSIDAQQLVTRAIATACAIAIQNAAINGSGSGANPTGILNTSGIGSVAMGTNGLALTWPKITELEREIAVDDALMGRLAYLTNPKVADKMKTTLKASGVAGYLMENGNSNGYKVAVSNGVPSTLDKGTSTGVCSAMILGAWDKLMIGQWGGLDVVVDPYSLATKNEVKIVVNQFVDVALENPAYFAAIKDILTA